MLCSKIQRWLQRKLKNKRNDRKNKSITEIFTFGDGRSNALSAVNSYQSVYMNLLSFQNFLAARHVFHWFESADSHIKWNPVLLKG